MSPIIKAVELDNGRLSLNTRTLHPDQPRAVAFSNDDGESFTEPKLEWSLEEPGYHTKLINETFELVGITNLGPFAHESDTMRPAHAAGCQVSRVATAHIKINPFENYLPIGQNE